LVGIVGVENVNKWFQLTDIVEVSVGYVIVWQNWELGSQS